MNGKKCLLSAIAVVAILFATDFVIHGMILKESYAATAALWRPMEEMHGLTWTTYALYAVNGLVLPYLYYKGVEAGKAPLGQGLRFGLLIGLMMASGWSLGTYFMVPMPGSLAATWFVAGMIQFALVGLALGAIIKPATA